MRRYFPAVGGLVLAVTALGALGVAGGSRASIPTASAATIVRPAAQVSHSAAVAPPAGKPEFTATFTGSTLNKKIWDTCYPYMDQNGCTNFGNSDEYEWYVPAQVKVSGGHLKLVAQRKSVIGNDVNKKPKKYLCSSGMVTSYPGFHFKYGFVQILADVPHATGLWPALWLAAYNETWPPEIDMLETWGVSHEEASFFHPVGAKYVKGVIPLSLTKGWQTYSLRWTSSKLTFYVGSKVVLTITKRVPHQAMYIVANLADYVNPATGGGCNGTMLIKSVKVWK